MFLNAKKIGIALSLYLLVTSAASAQLIVDTTLSTTTISVLGVSDTTSTSGTVQLLANPTTGPFTTAQVQDLFLTLDDSLNIPIGVFGGISTLGGDITLDLLTPGAPASVTGGLFSQVGNTLAATGDLNISDPFRLAGGSQTVDLGTFGNQIVDFDNIAITSVGSIATIDSTYSIITDVGGVDVTISGRFVATGPVSGPIAVPEPSTAMILIAGTMCAGFTRRRRI